MEDRLAHPAFDAVRPWLKGSRDLGRLNALAEAAGLRTESGRPVRFVPPAPADPYYELRVFETGCVATRPESRHDWLNALAWLAFPRTKARINAMHAAAIPGEKGRRGALRDLLTVFDEGGAVIACGDAGLVELALAFRWKALFWDRRDAVLRSMRVLVLGHAVLEKALEPWPGVTCKALFVGADADPDAAAAGWLAGLSAHASPRELPPVPVFGYPGWLPGSDRPGFYDDDRYFRRRARGKMASGVGQAVAAQAEESPGSAEQDAG